MTTKLSLFIASLLFAACASKPDRGSTQAQRPAATPASGHTIRFASTDGRFLGLTDGSLWNVDWQDAGAARTLRSGETVRVRRSGRSDFPYLLSTADGRSVAARHGKRLD